MSDIIRLARKMYADYDQRNADAGATKLEYLAMGGNPSHVISPERLAAFRQGGAPGLEAAQPTTRADGSVAAPYVPTELALAKNLIEPGAREAVMAANRAGIATVSSGVDGGRGYAVGRDRQGNVREVYR